MLSVGLLFSDASARRRFYKASRWCDPPERSGFHECKTFFIRPRPFVNSAMLLSGLNPGSSLCTAALAYSNFKYSTRSCFLSGVNVRCVTKGTIPRKKATFSLSVSTLCLGRFKWAECPTKEEHRPNDCSAGFPPSLFDSDSRRR